MQTSIITLLWLLCALKVHIYKASSSSGCLVFEILRCGLIYSEDWCSLQPYTCHAALSFHPLLAPPDINTYPFCTCTNGTEGTCWRNQWEKSLFDCSPLTFTSSTQFTGDAALSTVLHKWPIRKPAVCLRCFALLTLKSLSLPLKCHKPLLPSFQVSFVHY